jgi:hypothetical protein
MPLHPSGEGRLKLFITLETPDGKRYKTVGSVEGFVVDIADSLTASAPSYAGNRREEALPLFK